MDYNKKGNREGEGARGREREEGRGREREWGRQRRRGKSEGREGRG